MKKVCFFSAIFLLVNQFIFQDLCSLWMLIGVLTKIYVVSDYGRLDGFVLVDNIGILLTI